MNQNSTEYKLAPLPVRLAVRFIVKGVIPALGLVALLVVLHAIPEVATNGIANWMGR